jgi:hypothetical protein
MPGVTKDEAQENFRAHVSSIHITKVISTIGKQFYIIVGDAFGSH